MLPAPAPAIGPKSDIGGRSIVFLLDNDSASNRWPGINRIPGRPAYRPSLSVCYYAPAGLEHGANLQSPTLACLAPPIDARIPLLPIPKEVPIRPFGESSRAYPRSPEARGKRDGMSRPLKAFLGSRGNLPSRPTKRASPTQLPGEAGNQADDILRIIRLAKAHLA